MGRERTDDVTQASEEALLCQYEVCIVNVQQVERGSAGKKFAELAVAFLSTADPKCRLDQSVVNVIEASLKQFSPSKAVDAFIHMENYALNLLEMPWKTEFHKIVMYSGFYKIKIENQLNDPEQLFQLLGYQRQRDCLQLTSIPARQRIKTVALNFRLASVECELIDKIQRALSPIGVNLSVVFQYRQEVKGDASRCAEFIRENFLSRKASTRSKTPDYGIVTYSRPKVSDGMTLENLTESGKFKRSGKALDERPSNVLHDENRNLEDSDQVYYGFPLAAGDEIQTGNSMKTAKEKKRLSPSKVKPMIWDKDPFVKEIPADLKNPSFSTFRKDKNNDFVGLSNPPPQQRQLHTGSLATEFGGRTLPNYSTVPVSVERVVFDERQSSVRNSTREPFSEANFLDDQDLPPPLAMSTSDPVWGFPRSNPPTYEQSTVEDFDELATLLKDLSPDKLNDPALRKQVKARLDPVEADRSRQDQYLPDPNPLTFPGIRGDEPPAYQSWQTSISNRPPLTPSRGNTEPIAPSSMNNKNPTYADTNRNGGT